MKRNWILAGIILLVCVGGLLAVNKFTKQQDVLAGLQGVRVRVMALSPDAKETSLTRENLGQWIAGLKFISSQP